jgi:ATP-dependent Clp protease protease subunit
MKKLYSILMAALMLGSSALAQPVPIAPVANEGGVPRIVLTKDNTAILSDVVEGSTVSSVIQQVQKLDSALKSGYPIYLVLYTPGGSIQDGLELIEYLKTVNRPVHTITMFAASMGFQIAQSLNTRYILQTGVLMSHKAKGGFEGEFGDGNSQIDSRYGLWMERIKELDEQTVKRTKGKQTLASYRAAYQNELWLTGSKAVSQGYADEVVTATCSSELSAGTRTQDIQIMMFTIHVTYSACPLNTNPLAVEMDIPTNKGLMAYSEFLKKGGVFIKDLKGNKALTEGYDAYSLPDLYCTDPTLSMSDVKNKAEEVKKEIIARQRRVVKGY